MFSAPLSEFKYPESKHYQSYLESIGINEVKN